jgi:periplasmic divalent cation tolerance protein
MIRAVLCTFPDAESAAGAIRTLVSENLAACGSIISGVRSIYRWQGKIEDAPEVVAIIKIPSATAERFTARLAELHPYDVPEIVFFAPDRVNHAYEQWVLGSLP